jgi:hypothetical protein
MQSGDQKTDSDMQTVSRPTQYGLDTQARKPVMQLTRLDVWDRLQCLNWKKPAESRKAYLPQAVPETTHQFPETASQIVALTGVDDQGSLAGGNRSQGWGAAVDSGRAQLLEFRYHRNTAGDSR